MKCKLCNSWIYGSVYKLVDIKYTKISKGQKLIGTATICRRCYVILSNLKLKPIPKTKW